MVLEKLEELMCCWTGVAGEELEEVAHIVGKELEVAHTETEGLVLCC